MAAENDTIAQIATASGAGGVGIVRISGPQARLVGRAAVGLASADERRMVFVHVRDASGEIIDEGLYVELVGPRSMTGEDVAELQVHGGRVGLQRVLGRCLELGARAAEPGEFLRRAFEHGKIDLARAEAVAQAVAAETEAAHRIAQQQLAGALSRRIAEIRGPLVDAATALNADLEFPDEDLGGLDTQAVLAQLRSAKAAVLGLLGGFRAGRLLAEGATVAIVGPPNAGKSSLLNALVGYDRAIVSPEAGTTRDTVEERVVLGGAPVRFVDTAGLRAAADAVERAGIDRARAAMARADAVVAVVSADTDWAAFAQAEAREGVLWVCNKADVAPPPPAWTDVVGAPVLAVSARTGEGLGELRSALTDRLFGNRGEELPLVTLERHAGLLREAAQALDAALAGLGRGASSETALVDVGISIHRLGAVIGEDVQAEVYGEIFRRFCIGK